MDDKFKRAKKKAQNKTWALHYVSQQKLKQEINRLFASEEGIRFLAWLGDDCSFWESGVIRSHATGEVNQMATLYNTIRRGVFTDIRKMLRLDILLNVEECYAKRKKGKESENEEDSETN